MSFKHFLLTGAIAGSILTSCVDNNYDLSDIDSTVRVDIKDLTIPIKLDDILLSSIIDESDQLKAIDGQYVVTQDGRFNSSEIKVDNFTLTSRNISPTIVDIPFVSAAIGDQLGYFDIVTPREQFHFSADGIPAEIISIDKLGATIKFKFNITLNGLLGVARRAQVTDLNIQLPKGLHVTSHPADSYNATTGIIEIPAFYISNENFTLEIVADSVNFNTLGGIYNYNSHSATVDGDFYVHSGKFAISSADVLPGSHFTTLRLTINYEIPGFSIKTFSGNVKYDITGVNISDVVLNDIPDVLNQAGTNISLANPQIYLSVNNPMQSYGLTAQTGLTITSKHNDNSSESYSIDNPFFSIGKTNANAQYTFCLAPEDPTTKLAGFENAKFVAFTSLSGVLSGNGLPKSLGITLDNPCLPDQSVTDLQLGSNLGKITGSYNFYAPVELQPGSKIVYSDVVDGWNDEDLDELTIETLTVKATLISDIPLDLDIKAYPIDKDGNQINNVQIIGLQLAASTQPQDVEITITGEIRHLDGISLTATATAKGTENVLRPNMNIKVTNLRPTVSGYYEKEL